MSEWQPIAPYVAPEHIQIIADAEKAVREYNEYLLESIKARLDKKYVYISPPLREISDAEQEFKNDPTRKLLYQHLSLIKSIYEVPRFIKNTSEPA